MAGDFRRHSAWDQNIARCRLAQEAGCRRGAGDTMEVSTRSVRPTDSRIRRHVGGGTPGSIWNAYPSSALHLSDRKDARSTDQPPAYADDRSAPSRHSPERSMTTAESLFSEAKSRHAASGIRRVHTSTVNSPPPHSTRAQPSRFRPSSRHTGRSRPGSTHAARSGSSSWRSGTRSASGTRSCRPCRDPAR